MSVWIHGETFYWAMNFQFLKKKRADSVVQSGNTPIIQFVK